jgi:hypothetical protein
MGINKDVIPVVVNNCRLPFKLANLWHIDFNENYGNSLKELLLALGRQHKTIVQKILTSLFRNQWINEKNYLNYT